MTDYEDKYRYSSPLNFQSIEVAHDYSLPNKSIQNKTSYEPIKNSNEYKASHENLQVQLNDAKSQVERFRTEFLRLSKERIDEQCELAKVVELLRNQLETVSQERDQVITKTNMESKQTGKQFEHLKNCVNQLLETNTEQEKLMSEMNERLDASNRELGRYKSALERINSTFRRFDSTNELTDITDYKRTDFAESSYYRLDKILKILEEKEHLQNIEIEKLKTKIEVLQSQHEAEICRIEEKHQSSLRRQCDQLQGELNKTVIRAENATMEARTLSVEVTNARSNYEKEIAEKRERIQELEKELMDFKSKQNDLDLNSRKALETVLDTTQKELIKMKCERDSATSQLSTLNAKLEAAESYITDLDNRLNKQSTVDQTIRNQLDESNKLNKHLQSTMKSIELSIQRLQCLVVNDLNLCTDWNCGKVIKEDQISEFIDSVIKVISELHMKSFMNKENKSQTKRLRRQVEELNEELDKFKSTFKNNQRSLSEYKKALAAKVNEFETIISERDYYLQIINEQTEELSTTKAEYHRQVKELTEQIKSLKTQSLSHCKCSQSKLRKGTSNERCNTCCKSVKKPASTGSLLSDQRLAAVEYEKQASENAIGEMKKQMNESKSKYAKSTTKPESYDYASGDRSDEKLNTFKEKLNATKVDLDMVQNAIPKQRITDYTDNAIHTNASNSTSHSSTINKLEQRLADLEMNMYKASEEKQSLRNKNEQLTDLLRRMTEQNQRLTKELDYRVLESATSFRSRNYPFQRTVDNSYESSRNTQYYSPEQAKVNNDENIWNEEKFKDDDYKSIRKLKEDADDHGDKRVKKLYDSGDSANSVNHGLDTASTVQSNRMKSFYCTPEHITQGYKSDTARTFSPVSDSAILLTSKSNVSSSELDLNKITQRRNDIDYLQTSKENKYPKEGKDFRLSSKISDKFTSSINATTNPHITTSNYRQFLNFDYQNTKDNLLKDDIQYTPQMNTSNSELKFTNKESTNHDPNNSSRNNNNNNGIMKWGCQQYEQSSKTYSKDETNIYPVNTLKEIKNSESNDNQLYRI
ncbi:unnamed protein product [Trichobilharzia szidati]|nr:unnamed protein product [Trichobilharzia szidati]